MLQVLHPEMALCFAQTALYWQVRIGKSFKTIVMNVIKPGDDLANGSALAITRPPDAKLPAGYWV